MQTISFSKMHGLGNDFVVIDAINQRINLSSEQIRFIADRHFGIGCDQLLLVEGPTSHADFRYRIFNADGGEVEQCGNGARCFARFVHDQGLTNKDEISVETKTGIIYPRLESNGQVSVNMGTPQFDPAALPFLADAQQPNYQIMHQGEAINIGAVSMGNPHAVCKVSNINTAAVASLGPLISTHPDFPQGVNAGFMQVIDRGHIRLRVYERGAAETLACGTGACAAMVIGRQWGELDDSVKVDLPGGQLLIRWQGDAEPVWMTGPATHVFEGKIEI
ncbi:MAG TPA: diaminopimelate epimerase [Candidatus Tenderia electrophaga]|uniref:Diaminopimelate epimerase n=1 Tax=Candidatus Tenderia electrophaga TaxID=1748243 RepID=A0A832J4P2_9GAMM|nr:diaminopimelate epimerase [Candidatus Tenderia electrophaga]